MVDTLADLAVDSSRICGSAVGGCGLTSNMYIYIYMYARGRWIEGGALPYIYIRISISSMNIYININMGAKTRRGPRTMKLTF